MQINLISGKFTCKPTNTIQSQSLNIDERLTIKSKNHVMSSLFWWNDQCYVICWGRHHRRVFIFCQCEADAITLIRHQLWLSTPTSSIIAFYFELLKLYYGLLLEGHVSLKRVCSSVSTRQSKHKTTPEVLLITDDFIFHLDDQTNIDAQCFTEF